VARDVRETAEKALGDNGMDFASGGATGARCVRDFDKRQPRNHTSLA